MDTQPPQAPPESGRALDWLAVALLCGCSALAALLELLFIPLYAGSVVVPVVVLAAIVSNIVLPRLGGAAVGRTVGAVAPFVVWLAVVTMVGLYPRPEGDVVLPGSGALELVAYGVLLGGTLAGTVTVVLAATPKRQPVSP